MYPWLMSTKTSFLSAFALLVTLQAAQAEPRTSITRTSPYHTEIVIHDNSLEARQAHRLQAEQARRRREQREQRQWERAAVDRNVDVRPAFVPRSDSLESIRERQKYHAQRNEPPHFFNGGRWTGGQEGLFLGGPGFGFFPGVGFPVVGFPGPGFVGPGFPGGYCGPGFQGGFRQPVPYRGHFRGGGFRGGICR